MDAEVMPPAKNLLATAIAFAACHLGGFALLGELLGSFGDRDSTFADYYASSSNQSVSVLGAALLLAGSVLLVAFLTQLAARLSREQPAPFGVGAATTVMAASLLAAASASLGTVGGARKFGFGDSGQLVGLEGVLPQLGLVLVVCSTVPLAVTMVAFAYHARHSRFVGPWFASGTTVLAVFMVVAGLTVVVPMLVPPAWSITVAARVHRSTTPPSASHA